MRAKTKMMIEIINLQTQILDLEHRLAIANVVIDNIENESSVVCTNKNRSVENEETIKYIYSTVQRYREIMNSLTPFEQIE